MTNIRFILSAIAVSIVFATTGCGADDEIDATVDCFEICSKYDTCREEIDVTACTDACEDEVDVSATVERQAEECEACVEDVACEPAEVCWADCPVVPLED